MLKEIKFGYGFNFFVFNIEMLQFEANLSF